MSSTNGYNGPHKRRSPPPSASVLSNGNPSNRTQSPGSFGIANGGQVEGSEGIGSSSLFVGSTGAARGSAKVRSGRPNSPVSKSAALYDPTTAIYNDGAQAKGSVTAHPEAKEYPGLGGSRPPNTMNGLTGFEEGAGRAVSDSSGGYAYSTTLRRQPSIDPSFPPFPSSHAPHRLRGFSGSSQAYGEGPSSSRRPGGLDLDPGSMDDEGSYTGRLVSWGKKMLGRPSDDGYELVRAEQAEAEERQRRARETPSAIYAHKTVQVRHSIALLRTGVN